MGEALFLRLLSYDDKSAALVESINEAQKGQSSDSNIHVVDPLSFSQIPGSTFAYWVSEKIRHIFIELPAFENEGRTVKQGLATADDFRFIRLWWEVKPENTVSGTLRTRPEQFLNQTFQGRYWIPIAKGGSYSPYYSDIHLVVNWERDAEDLRNFRDPQTGKAFSYLRNTNYYFRSGLTWSRRTSSGISVRILPQGCTFADKGPAAFANDSDKATLLALMNTQAFEALVALQLGAADAAARSYEVGLIQKIPIPDYSNSNGVRLDKLAIATVHLKRNLDTINEISHFFYLPALLELKGSTLREGLVAWQARITEAQQYLEQYQHEIDDITFQLYGFTDGDRRGFEDSLESGGQVGEIDIRESEVEDENHTIEANADPSALVTDLLSYIMGCAFGRWDVRFVTNERVVPEPPDPFAPLPTCSTGMLASNGLPLYETPSGYPLEINWQGFLVDDSNHQDDIVHCAQEVLRTIWHDHAEAIEQEVCQILEVKELREYFRRPGNSGFWMDHVRRYSKSRRKAPIYWLLQSSKKNYALWLYYHRLDKDTLFKALTKYVEPKIRLEDSYLEQWRTQMSAIGSEGREVKQLERQVERQETLVVELYDFRDKLRRAADLNLEPDLNDGVVLNIAPLWELVPWSEAKKYWDELLAGKYEWSTISKQLRNRGVI